MPASTVETVRAEGFVVLRDVVVIDLTRFCRDASAGRNLITVFSTVNSLAQIFSCPALERIRSRRGRCA